MNELLQWEPRVKMADIYLLYQKLAKESYDDELINEIVYAFFSRCQSIIEVTQAERGAVTCKLCGGMIKRINWQKDEILECKKCEWRVKWGDYFESYPRKQLSGGSAYPLFQKYVNRLPHCSNVNEKVLLIDWIIHQCHISILPEQNKFSARPAAVNLIEGRMGQIIPFLNTLPLSPDPTMQTEYENWKALMVKAMNLPE